LKRPAEIEKVRARRPIFVLFALLLFFDAGCRTANLLPPADFETPGWCVQQGQAVWKPASNRPELAGDLLLALNVNGNFFVQFSKMPFLLATAQISGDRWQIEFGADTYSWRGSGTPPSRFGWLQLQRALRSGDAGGDWRFTRPDANSWRLENPHTGELLEGEFFP